MYNRSISPDRQLLVSSTKTLLDRDLLTKLTQRLHFLLRDYIVDNRLGSSLAYILGGATEITVDEFALEVVKAVAIWGPERTTQLLYKWARGEPTQYRTYAVLSGIGVDEPLEVKKGIRFEMLPSSLGGLLAHLPSSDPWKFDQPGLTGKLKVTIDRKGGPTLCKPQAQKGSWAYGPGPGNVLNSLCEVLSLTCNEHVTWKAAWSECDELKAFTLGTRLGYTTRLGYSYGNALLLQEHLTELDSLLRKRSIDRSGEGPLDIPVSRWLRSKRYDSLANQFIELRIALEALYVKSDRQSKTSQIANHGARHLGSNPIERSEYKKKLRTVYKLASKAVHEGEVEYSEKNRIRLAEAQDLCRKGILKRLDESKEPDRNY